MLPERVKIGAFNYDVQHNELLADDGDRGRILLLRGVIELNPNMSVDMERMTLVHEILHAILYHAGFAGEPDERILDVLAHGLVDLAQENPELLR